jgi:hypothetical protein
MFACDPVTSISAVISKDTSLVESVNSDPITGTLAFPEKVNLL